MTAYHLVFDPNRCMGCNACEVSCKMENRVAIGPRWRRVYKGGDGPGTFFFSMSCNHCEDPACYKACPKSPYPIEDPRNAIYREPTVGAIVINNGMQGTPAICVGCRRCEWACPYGAPQFNETTSRMEKCHLCTQSRLHRPDSDGVPRPACVNTCGPRALQVTDDPNEPYRLVRTMMARDGVTEVPGIPTSEQKAGWTNDPSILGGADKHLTNPRILVRPKE